MKSTQDHSKAFKLASSVAMGEQQVISISLPQASGCVACNGQALFRYRRREQECTFLLCGGCWLLCLPGCFCISLLLCSSLSCFSQCSLLVTRRLVFGLLEFQTAKGLFSAIVIFVLFLGVTEIRVSRVFTVAICRVLSICSFFCEEVLLPEIVVSVLFLIFERLHKQLTSITNTYYHAFNQHVYGQVRALQQFAPCAPQLPSPHSR